VQLHLIHTKTMKVCLLMFYDDAIKNYGDINYAINKKYCEKYNIDIIVSNTNKYFRRHSAWARLPLILDNIEYYDYLIWIDADAFLYNDATNIIDIITDNIDYNFIFSNDIGNDNVNTGIFIVKNSQYSIDFLKLWAYDNELYVNNPYPGWWDQGVLIDMFNKNILDIKHNSVSIEYGILQHFYENELSTFNKKPLILHLVGRINEIRLNTFKKYFDSYFKSQPAMIEDCVKYLFDIVIPVGPEDREIVTKQIEFTKKNIIGYRNIYLICYDPTITLDGCIKINEHIFPFTIDTVAKFHGKLSRNGWYLQQLLKLYAGIVIPNILDKYLVIDSDTFFLKPTTFIENGKCLYNYGDADWPPYFVHMHKLVNFKNVVEKSGICHHMMFETKYVKELIQMVETKHGDLFYNVFLQLVTEINGSGASEYEIYFNYILKNHNDQITTRKLEWVDISSFNMTTDDDCTDIPYDYLSYHYYKRN
jgi:hypothetical protein